MDEFGDAFWKAPKKLLRIYYCPNRVHGSVWKSETKFLTTTLCDLQHTVRANYFLPISPLAKNGPLLQMEKNVQHFFKILFLLVALIVIQTYTNYKSIYSSIFFVFFFKWPEWNIHLKEKQIATERFCQKLWRRLRIMWIWTCTSFL